MKNLVIALLFTLSAVFSATAQRAQPDSIRLYRVGDYFVKDNSGGTKPEVLPISEVQVKKNSTLVQVRIGDNVLLYTPASFLDKNGTAYSSTNSYLAVKAFRDALPATTGTTSSTITDYTTGTNTVTTTGCFEINVENTGATSATVTYGGFVYTLAAGSSRTFDRKRDPKSGRHVPFQTLTVTPVSSTLRVIKYPEQ